jgi:hypothetical protein
VSVGGGRKKRGADPVGPGLFPPGSLSLRPTGAARLRRLARRPSVPATVRERVEREEREVMARLRRWGAELGGIFGLRCTALEAERDEVTDWYGVCYEDGVIRIRLRNARTGRLLKESSMVDTLCHELAHLRFLDHGLRFRRLYQQILNKARELEIYRPGPAGDGRPRQGLLFDGGGCGTLERGRRRGGDATTA